MFKKIFLTLPIFFFSASASAMTCEWTCTQQDDYGVCVKWVSKCTSADVQTAPQSLGLLPDFLSQLPASFKEFKSTHSEEGSLDVELKTVR
jgi:hypothetical protein